MNTSELDNCLTQRDQNLVQTENGNTYRKTYTLTKTGAAVGLAAPVAVKGFELFKAGALKNIFKSKSLLVSCPLVAAAGLGIGWLLDGLINSKRAQKQMPRLNLKFNRKLNLNYGKGFNEKFINKIYPIYGGLMFRLFI